jgi:hypothetical protein
MPLPILSSILVFATLSVSTPDLEAAIDALRSLKK